jgi:hypothetical protein
MTDQATAQGNNPPADLKCPICGFEMNTDGHHHSGAEPTENSEPTDKK